MLLDWDKAMQMVAVTGVIHVGAHYAEERPFYLAHGITRIVWVEADPWTVRWLRRRVPEPVYEYALCNVDGEERTLYIASNRSMSSSLLKPKAHLNKYPRIRFEKSVTVRTATLDALVEREELTGYNLLWVDVQGAELMVLRGGERTLRQMDALALEVNFCEMYEGCVFADELDAWLAERGFGRVMTHKTGRGWADAFYVRD